MAQNTLPRQPGALLILAAKCGAGLTTYAAPLNITQLTPASLAADAGTLSTAMGDFNATRAATVPYPTFPALQAFRSNPYVTASR